MKQSLLAIVVVLLTATSADAQSAADNLRELNATMERMKAQQAAEIAERQREQAKWLEEQRVREEAIVTERKREEQARAKAEAERYERQRKIEEAEASERARLATIPSNRLLQTYRMSALITWCHEVREGYAYKYINDAELDRASIAIKAIVKQVTKDDATIDTDAIWQQALDEIQPHIRQLQYDPDFTRRACQEVLHKLFAQSPTQVYSIPKP